MTFLAMFANSTELLCSEMGKIFPYDDRVINYLAVLEHTTKRDELTYATIVHLAECFNFSSC